jgi:hypothetical protein
LGFSFHDRLLFPKILTRIPYRLASRFDDYYRAFMIEDVRHHLEAGPFEPFAIVTSSGHRYVVPSSDHAGINPRGNRIVIWFDDGGSVTLSALHITAVEKQVRTNGHA